MQFGQKKEIKYPSKIKIFLEFEKGLSPIYKQWTHEAVTEFINLFPQQKNLFEIENKTTNQTLDTVLEKHPKGLLDLSQLHLLYQQYDKNNTVHYTVAVLNSLSQYEIGMGGDHWVLMAASNIGMKKRFFKNLVKHELGHTFGAVHRQQNFTDVMGRHCTDYSCVMSLGAYTEDGHTKFNDDKPFCKECMSDMCAFMENLQQKCREDNVEQNIQQTPSKSFSFGKKTTPKISFGKKSAPTFYFGKKHNEY